MTCHCSCHTLALIGDDGEVIHQAPLAAPTVEDLLPHDRPLTLHEAAAFAEAVLKAATPADLKKRAGTVKLARTLLAAQKEIEACRAMERRLEEYACALEKNSTPGRIVAEGLRNQMRGV